MTGISIWGDSIAKGVIYDEARRRYAILRDNCVARLQREAGVNVRNFAVMGSTSEKGLARMQEQAKTAGELAVIEFGGNDCDLDWGYVSEHPEQLQNGNVPLDRFEENLCGMIREARQANMRPVLVTPPPLLAQRYFRWVSQNRDESRILRYLGDVEHIYRWQERYALRIRAIAQREKTALFDLRELFLAQQRMPDLVCVDGIHPNQLGHDMMYNAILDKLHSLALGGSMA
ncbi:MAG: SGNH/GDSL hydrolase family protein [Clostridia bacterium]|nr:SGNH/GDSL hydrolase family protein [Clostridia bacterium]